MAELAFDTTVNYQKIFMSGSYAAGITNGNFKSATTITHSLGRAPNVRVWFTTASGKISTAVQLDTGDKLNSGGITEYLNLGCYYAIYDNTVVITFGRTTTSGTSNTTIYYRIYYDGA